MNQKGFTLIELVVVIVVLGILAAVAVPKFIDLSEDAERASVKAVAGSLASASAMNYGKYRAESDYTNVAGCTDTVGLMESYDTAKYSVEDGNGTDGDNTIDCNVFTPITGTPKYSANFAAFLASD